MEQMGKYFDATEGRLSDMRDEMTGWKEELRGEMTEWKAEIKDHFDVVAENIKHDFQSAFHDKLEQHEDRIRRLEENARLAV